MAAVAGSRCEAAAATAAAATLAPPGCGIWSVVLAGCGMVRGFVFTMVASSFFTLVQELRHTAQSVSLCD